MLRHVSDFFECGSFSIVADATKQFVLRGTVGGALRAYPRLNSPGRDATVKDFSDQSKDALTHG